MERCTFIVIDGATHGENVNHIVHIVKVKDKAPDTTKYNSNDKPIQYVVFTVAYTQFFGPYRRRKHEPRSQNKKAQQPRLKDQLVVDKNDGCCQEEACQYGVDGRECAMYSAYIGWVEATRSNRPHFFLVCVCVCVCVLRETLKGHSCIKKFRYKDYCYALLFKHGICCLLQKK